jgi:tetratricopeptide (TPR) repeat protein
MLGIIAWLVFVVAFDASRLASADAGPDAEAAAQSAFNTAVAREDIAALEALGAAEPRTRWTDDAWAEAARLALKTSDFARARRALEQVIALGTDPQLVRRARNDLERIEGFSGRAGELDAIAAEHERLVPQLHRGGDPQPTLEKLEALVRAHPHYPRAPMLMLSIAHAWEREGDADRAIRWLREAERTAHAVADKQRISAELVRTLIRTGHLAAAEQQLAVLARGNASHGLVVNLRKALDRAELRRAIRYAMWAVLVLLATVAIVALRRAAGSWRAALRRLARPPLEALFLLPIAGVVAAFALTGNPLISRTVIAILVAGIATSWISGAILDGQRVGLRRAALHAALCSVAVLASVYLAVDRRYVIDFVIETWHRGHERG